MSNEKKTAGRVLAEMIGFGAAPPGATLLEHLGMTRSAEHLPFTDRTADQRLAAAAAKKRAAEELAAKESAEKAKADGEAKAAADRAKAEAREREQRRADQMAQIDRGIAEAQRTLDAIMLGARIGRGGR